MKFLGKFLLVATALALSVTSVSSGHDSSPPGESKTFAKEALSFKASYVATQDVVMVSAMDVSFDLPVVATVPQKTEATLVRSRKVPADAVLPNGINYAAYATPDKYANGRRFANNKNYTMLGYSMKFS